MTLGARASALMIVAFVFAFAGATGTRANEVQKQGSDESRKNASLVTVSYVAEPRVLLVRVPSLYAGATRDLGNALRMFFASGSKVLDGLVLDLRDNHGGVLPEAPGIVSAFLRPGMLVAQIDAKRDTPFPIMTGRAFYQFNPSEPDFLRDLPPALQSTPLVVIVNRRTANGGEIVASALHGHGRAVLVGNRTAGLTGLTTDGASDGRWRDVRGRALDGIGLPPDVEVVDGTERQSDQPDRYVAAALRRLSEGKTIVR